MSFDEAKIESLIESAAEGAAAGGIKKATLIVFASVDGRGNWHPLHQNEVPAWVKEPRTMGRLVAGEMCCDAAEGDRGSSWYKVERVQ